MWSKSGKIFDENTFEVDVISFISLFAGLEPGIAVSIPIRFGLKSITSLSWNLFPDVGEVYDGISE